MARTRAAAALILASLTAGGSNNQSAAASISGRVAILRPQQRLSDVRAFRVWTTAQGERTIGGPPGGHRAEFDDMTGEYRISRLPAADYVVVTTVTSATGLTTSDLGQPLTSRIGPIFYPAALELPAAEIITVAAAADVRGIDLSVVDRSWSTIQGRVVDASDKPVSYAQVEIGLASLPAALRPMLGLQRARQSTESAFLFRVPPGRYVIAARGSVVQVAGAPPAHGHLGWADVTANGFDVNDVIIRLEPGATVAGRVTFSGSGARPDLHDVVVRVTPAGDDAGLLIPPIPSGVAADGTFRIHGIAPGRYTLDGMVGGVRGWSVEQVIAGGQDPRDRPLEIGGRESIAGALVTLTDRPTELTCTVQDASGAPTALYPIAIVPADPALRRAGSPRLPAPARPSPADGRHVVTALPPGDYLIFALADLDDDAWRAGIWPEFDPAAAVPVSIGAGEKKTVAVRIGR